MDLWKTRIENVDGVPILQDKFNGKEEEKRIKTLPDAERAEYHCYRMIEGNRESNLAIPAAWISGCLIKYLVNTAPPKMKKKTEYEVASAIQVQPVMIDLGINVYVIDRRAVPVYKNGMIVDMDFVVRPRIDVYKAEFLLITTLDKTMEEFKRIIEEAGRFQGIGSDRKHGYGRFKLTLFERSK
jgi:hypothetical protein